MAKHRKSSQSSPITIDGLREEVDEEIRTEKIGTRLLEDIQLVNLKQMEHVIPDVVLCDVIMRFGLAVVCSIARVLLSLQLLPIDVRCQVMKILCPLTVIHFALSLCPVTVIHFSSALPVCCFPVSQYK